MNRRIPMNDQSESRPAGYGDRTIAIMRPIESDTILLELARLYRAAEAKVRENQAGELFS